MKNKLGFTLIEMMITVAIVAILAGVAAPSMTDMVRRNRLTTITNELITTLTYARSEAVLRGATVMLCNSTVSTTPTCATSNSWSNGWIIFLDTDGNGALDKGETILRVWAQTATDLTIEAATSNSKGIAFDRTGQARGINNSGTITSGGAFKICSSAINEGRSANVSATGRASTSKETTCGTP